MTSFFRLIVISTCHSDQKLSIDRLKLYLTNDDINFNEI